jgi:capsular exopolysaccharide synthesis family protein
MTNEVLSSDLIARLREQETELLRRLGELQGKYGDRHPVMINLRAELRDLQSKIDSEIAKIVGGMANEVEVARSREKALSENLARLQRNVSKLSMAEVRLGELEREAAANRALFEAFLARFKQSTAVESIQQPDAKFVSAASVPAYPIWPKPMLMTVLAAIGAGLVGCAISLTLDRLDKGMRFAKDVEATLGLPLLGMVPLAGRMLQNTGAHDYVVKNPISAYSEAIRSILTTLHMDADTPRPVLLITSSAAGEGKTALSISLGRVSALMNQRTLLIDCDVRHPSVAARLGIPSGRGLLEVLEGKLPLTQAVQRDEHTGLDVLTARGALPNYNMFGPRGRMKQILHQAIELYDLVLIDTPPVLAVGDTLLLAGLADSVILAVQWARTPKDSALEALRILRHAGAPASWAVLTQVNLKEHAAYGQSDQAYYYRAQKKYYQH